MNEPELTKEDINLMPDNMVSEGGAGYWWGDIKKQAILCIDVQAKLDESEADAVADIKNLEGKVKELEEALSDIDHDEFRFLRKQVDIISEYIMDHGPFPGANSTECSGSGERATQIIQNLQTKLAKAQEQIVKLKTLIKENYDYSHKKLNDARERIKVKDEALKATAEALCFHCPVKVRCKEVDGKCNDRDVANEAFISPEKPAPCSSGPPSTCDDWVNGHCTDNGRPCDAPPEKSYIDEFFKKYTEYEKKCEGIKFRCGPSEKSPKPLDAYFEGKVECGLLGQPIDKPIWEMTPDEAMKEGELAGLRAGKHPDPGNNPFHDRDFEKEALEKIRDALNYLKWDYEQGGIKWYAVRSSLQNSFIAIAVIRRAR